MHPIMRILIQVVLALILLMVTMCIFVLLFSKPASAQDWSEEEIECMALNIYHEARGESEEGRLAVGFVVKNRVQSPSFPGTVCEVVKEGYDPRNLNTCQFSWYCDGRADDPRDIAAWNSAILDAVYVLSSDLDITHGATNYHATYVSPRWSDVKFIKQIGRHKFYRRLDLDM